MQSFTFDLLTQAFIEVRFLDGSQNFLGLRDLFENAGRIREIHTDSPLVNIGLLRFLEAVVHVACESTDDKTAMEQWKMLWGDATGSLLAQKVNAYFDRHPDRFDLFHLIYPLYQSSAFRTAEPIHACNLAAEMNVGFFNHRYRREQDGRTPAEAFLIRVAAQCSSVDGLVRRDLFYPDGTTEPCFRFYKAPFYNNVAIFLDGTARGYRCTTPPVPGEGIGI